MSSVMGLDVRKPIGSLFVLLGALLAIYDLSSATTRATHGQIDLEWGVVMMLFGIMMLALSLHNRQRKPRGQ